jgi:proteasome activator subunit 4
MRANGNILLNYVDQIKDIIDWYRKCTHKLTVAYLCAGVRQFLRSLTFFYATESRSTSQCLDFENENIFKQYLPVRDWGKYGDLNNLNINYHIPNEIELRTAIDFVQFYIQQSIENLNKNSNNMHKDERFRELSFIYNIIVGSARLLRRADSPVNNDQ